MTASHDFCQRQGIPAGRFEATAFRRALYPHARLLRGVVSLMQADFFSIDRELVRTAGGTASSREFRLEELEFHNHPENSGVLRRYLLLRISTRRLHKLLFPSVRRTGSTAPMPLPPASMAAAALNPKRSRT